MSIELKTYLETELVRIKYLLGGLQGGDAENADESGAMIKTKSCQAVSLVDAKFHDPSIVLRDTYIRCERCHRIILGGYFDRGYVGARGGTIRKSEKIGGKNHKACAASGYGSPYPDTTCQFQKIEAVRVRLEDALKSRDAAEKAARDAKWEAGRQIWLYHMSLVKRLKAWDYLPESRVKDVDADLAPRDRCLCCGKAISGKPFIIRHLKDELDGRGMGVQQGQKGYRGMHRACAESWVKEHTWRPDSVSIPTVDAARSKIGESEAALAAASATVEKCQRDLSKAVKRQLRRIENQHLHVVR